MKVSLEIHAATSAFVNPPTLCMKIKTSFESFAAYVQSFEFKSGRRSD